MLEYLSMNIPQLTEEHVRTSPIHGFTWIPKALASHVDEEKNIYYKSKRELI